MFFRNSSWSDIDFVLFRMLEDTSYQNVVRWSEQGDSFIVLDVHFFSSDQAISNFVRTMSSQKVFCHDISNTQILQVLYGS